MAASKAETVENNLFNAPCLDPILYNLEDVESWQISLKTEGYAVIHNVIPKDERDHLVELFYNEFFNAASSSKEEGLLSQMDRMNKETWLIPDQLGRKSKHAPLHIAQSDFMWGLRTHPNILNIFSHVHNINVKHSSSLSSSQDSSKEVGGQDHGQLVTSLDSYSLQMRGHPSEGLVLHDDQGWGIDERSDAYSIQGSYNVYNCGVDDTGLMVSPKSHLRWNKRRSGTIGSRHIGNFIPIDASEGDEYIKAYENARKLLLPRNCFVIWNSKLLHGTCIGSRERPPQVIDTSTSTASSSASSNASSTSSESISVSTSTSSTIKTSNTSKDNKEGKVDVDIEKESTATVPSSPPSSAAAEVSTMRTLPRMNRVTCFISMSPKSLRAPQVLKDKISLYKNGGTTSHWATHAETHILNKAGACQGRLDVNGQIPKERLSLL